MKKLLVAIAVVASIGVTLLENSEKKVSQFQYAHYLNQGYSQFAACDDAWCESGGDWATFDAL